MATVQWTKQQWNGDGEVYKCTPLADGDETAPLTFPEGQVDISVQMYGTVGGATVTVQGSLLNSTFATVDDAYGVPMSYTVLSVIKPVGPALSGLKVVVTGGAEVAVSVDVKVARKVRP